MSPTDKEIQATSFWGKVNVVTLLLACVSGFIWIGSIQAKVERNTEDIGELKTDIQVVNDDIRAILIGIEQVKARLGIVEDKE